MNIEKLVSEIEDGNLITRELFLSQDLDEILDYRDSDPFDSQWLEAYENIKTFEKAASLDLSKLSKINALRELVFKKSSEFVNGHEISSYLSDDFELIGKALVLGKDEPFITSLLRSYRQNELKI